MGQKANPISLRLKTTNKNFTSCWYGDIFYPDIITQELRAKHYLSKLFALIKYPNPCLSTSFLPKKTKAIIIYLNPFESRRRGCEKFQLGLVPEASSLAPSMVSTLNQSRPKAVSSIIGMDQGHSIETAYERKKNENDVLSISQKHRTSFIEKLILSIAADKTTIKELIWRKNYQLFQKLHHIAWLQGREKHLFFFGSKQQNVSMTNTPLTAIAASSQTNGGNQTVEHSCADLLLSEGWLKPWLSS